MDDYQALCEEIRRRRRRPAATLDAFQVARDAANGQARAAAISDAERSRRLDEFKAAVEARRKLDEAKGTEGN